MVRHVAREMYGLYHLIITHNHSNFEFTSVLNFLNAGKAPGLDCICPEFLLRHKMFLKCLSELYFKKCPVNERIQHESCDKFQGKHESFFFKNNSLIRQIFYVLLWLEMDLKVSRDCRARRKLCRFIFGTS